MKKIWLACATLATIAISSCVDNEKDLSQEKSKEEVFDPKFSTEQNIQVEIDYSKSKSKVPFFIYDQYPLDRNENSISLKEDIRPLDGAWTNEDGKFTGEIKLPSYVSDVYIVSKATFAETIMKGAIVNGVLRMSDTDEQPATRATYRTSTKYDKDRFNNLKWNTNLGNYNNTTGVIDYKYLGKDPKLTLSNSEMKELRNTVNKVLNTVGSCPEDFRTNVDLYVEKENTAVVLTALKGWTCWNSSLGYYYYRQDESPKNLKDANVYAVFPNTQMTWNASGWESSPQGVTEGTAVELKFFGDPSHPEGTVFPKGYSIGFVLACNAWNTYFTGFNSHPQTLGYFSCSTKGLSSLGKDGIDVHTAMFSDKNKNIAIAFEDFKDDQNFTDVVFSLKANPEITNVPPVDEDLNTTIKKIGIYAFEDQWPQAGDYDMNDVLVQYTYEKLFNIYNEILQESFTFKTFANEANLKNGLAFILENQTIANELITVTELIKYNGSSEFVPFEFTHEQGNVIKITDNVKTKLNAEYKIILNYDKSIKKTKETSIDVFIYRPSNNNTRLEIHCPMKRPTSLADMTLFGQKDDRSVPNEGKYYVSDQSNVYPFAFYLPNASEEDIRPLLSSDNEGISISEFYPKFFDWAKNGTNADWYKKK